MTIISNTKRKILEEIKRNPCHGYVLSQKLKIPVTSVYVHLKELREKKLIESTDKDGRRTYKLTEKGKMLLKAIE